MVRAGGPLGQLGQRARQRQKRQMGWLGVSAEVRHHTGLPKSDWWCMESRASQFSGAAYRPGLHRGPQPR